ncbi:phosphopantetheine adenylyltransferase [Chthoniobacter flavus]|uniref:adenylyltransferase/cytidyltransferase family protein n=1 Tax=Chthoniobacter flavus TaxID=191863 RepID=UPI00104A16FA|nr:adenylyltransferase/cytidyltransferase family protein [Chthoniobacter flavus]TCO89667.1 phosphopantetheine adenylyltransferase [Chthoniobacter flavus]
MQDAASLHARRVAQLAATLAARIPLQYLRDPLSLDHIAARWCERQRVWHGPEHLLALLDEIDTLPAGVDRDILLLVALYHDAIYDPRAANNEEASAALLLAHAVEPQDTIIVQAAEIIVASKWSQPPTTPLAQRFFAMDARQLGDECPLQERLAYERAIFCEYQWADWTTYRTKRREFLQGWARMFPQHQRGVAECYELLAGLRPRVAVYPGSFAPFHLGHLSILRQAESVFDKVIIAVGVNRQKSGAVETAQARSMELQARLRYHEVASFTGLLTSFVEQMEVPVTVVRGVRDGTDLEAELRFVRFLNELRAGTGVVWISCEAEYQHLSSSAIRELEAIEPGAGERYVPATATIYDLVDQKQPGVAR